MSGYPSVQAHQVKHTHQKRSVLYPAYMYMDFNGLTGAVCGAGIGLMEPAGQLQLFILTECNQMGGANVQEAIYSSCIPMFYI